MERRNGECKSLEHCSSMRASWNAACSEGEWKPSPPETTSERGAQCKPVVCREQDIDEDADYANR